MFVLLFSQHRLKIRDVNVILSQDSFIWYEPGLQGKVQFQVILLEVRSRELLPSGRQIWIRIQRLDENSVLITSASAKVDSIFKMTTGFSTTDVWHASSPPGAIWNRWLDISRCPLVRHEQYRICALLESVNILLAGATWLPRIYIFFKFAPSKEMSGVMRWNEGLWEKMHFSRF